MYIALMLYYIHYQYTCIPTCILLLCLPVVYLPVFNSIPLSIYMYITFIYQPLCTTYVHLHVHLHVHLPFYLL